MSSELPPELWLTVFEHLPQWTLFSVCIVCSSFHSLSATLLYQEFNFRPAIYLQESTGGTVLARALDRLAFWSSDRVAPHVRRCHLSFHRGDIVVQSRLPLVNAFFETVSQFAKLEVLSCNIAGGWGGVELPALRIEKLAHLRKLQIHGGSLSRPASQTSFQLKIPHFMYTDIFVPRPQSNDEEPHRSCLSMLDATTLHTLELVAGHSLGLEYFLEDKITMASFQKLYSLSITFTATDFLRIHACVAPFPAVRDLTLNLKESCNVDMMPQTPLAPHLCRYSGPTILLPLVLCGSQPELLSVTRGSASELLAILRRTVCPSSITSLAIRVKFHEDIRRGTVLLSLLTLFPFLKHLALHVSSDEDDRMLRDSIGSPDAAGEELREKLVNILSVPPPLETVVFRWRLARADDRQIVPNASELWGRLRVVVPVLSSIEYSRLSAGPWGF
ncbi:hypothetical protein C8R44DRAFT_886158 [Mycena epipterygia]|nr:hypothetical protein C8R44DRAFT_886158 [Mycena epipterygia]